MAEIIGIQPTGADSVVGALTETLGIARTGAFANIAIVGIYEDGSVYVLVPPTDGGPKAGVYHLIGAIEQLKHDILAAKAQQEGG